MLNALVTKEALPTALTIVSMASDLSIDTETTGLELSDLPFAVIVGTKDHTLYFDDRVLGPELWPRFSNALNMQPRPIYLQNAKFDMAMLERVGVSLWIHQLHDCAVLARIKRNDHLNYSLDSQAKRELGVGKDDTVAKLLKADDKLWEARTDYFGNIYKAPRYDRIPVEDMAKYAIRDARLTYDLAVKYMSEIFEEHKDLIAMESQLVHTCYNMEQHGLKLNTDYTIKAMYHEQSLLQENKDKFKELTGKDFVNSAKSLAGVFALPLPTTDKGNPSLTDDVIDYLLQEGTPNDKEVATVVRNIRHYDKRISTYYQSYLTFKSRSDVIHPRMWQAGTRTGRFSYSDPNLQNIPKEEDSTDPYVVRGCFMPRPGKIFVSFDYSQMEYRMMAAYAGQMDVIEKVMNGADFHQATADLLGVSRKHAKTLNFAILYGAGADKIAAMLGISPAEAKRLKDKYFMALPKVEKFVDNVIGLGRARGHVFNWMNRKMYADYEYCYALPNHLIQGGGADVVKMAMVKLSQQFSFPMVLQIHDQLVFEMAPEEFKYINEIKEVMENIFPPKNGIKLTVDVSWSATSLAERDMTKGVPSELGRQPNQGTES